MRCPPAPRTQPIRTFGTSIVVASLLCIPTVRGRAQASADTARTSPKAPAAASDRSPRAAVQAFLTLTRAAQYRDASRYLDLPDSLVSQGAALAQQLKAVLDRHVWFDLDEISPLATGDTTDGLAPAIEQLAIIPTSAGPQPVRLSRREGAADDIYWAFSRGTVFRIPEWYAALGDHWLRAYLPPALLRRGPFELLWWQWIALVPLAMVAAAFGILFSRLARATAVRLARRTTVTWDDALVDRLGAPLTLAASVAMAALLVPVLELYRPAEVWAFRLIGAGLSAAAFWSLWRVVDVLQSIVAGSAWARASSASRALLPLTSRTAKVVLLAIAMVMLLSTIGYPVASLVAGLGLGGLAFALAAQKTVENLFGAFSIGVDQPFREGDFVKIEDFVGNVEAVGLRSTRFRTLDRTIITIPNGRLADMRLESFTARDRLRLATVIGVVYETTATQMREVLDGFERVLRAHPLIWPDAVVVRFREFAASSLDIEIMAWFTTADWGEFQLIRQNVLLQFMEVVEAAGTSFAFPTQTLHLASVPNGHSPDEAISRRNWRTV